MTNLLVPPHVRALLLWAVVAAAPRVMGAQPPTRPIGDSAAYQLQRSARHAFRVAPVVDSVFFPSALAWLPNGEMLLTERPGRLRIVRNRVLDPTPIAGVPAVWRARGQGGLLDIVLHPDFARNQLLYLSHGTGRDGDSSGTLAATSR